MNTKNNNQNGKGSKPRPVNTSVYIENWDKINWKIKNNKPIKNNITTTNFK